SSAILLVTENRALLFTDGLSRAQARAEIEGARTVIVAKAPVLAAGEWLVEHGKLFGRPPVLVGFESEHLTVASQKLLKSGLNSAFRLKIAPPLIEQERMVKDGAEIDRIRRAIQLGAGLFDVALKTIRPG